MQHDMEIRRLRDEWTIEDVPAGLADRISRHALAHKQHRPFFARVKDALAMPESAVSWKGGFAVAACIMIAIVVMETSAQTKQLTYQKPMSQLVEEMYFTY